VPNKESAAGRQYKGEYAAQTEAVYKIVERLWRDHRTSPTRAGDELVYAFGNLEYVIVVNQDLLDALVEVKTIHGNVDCFTDADGAVTCKLNADPKEGGRENADPKLILESVARAMEDYYYAKRLR
jgi:hypothetical protein